MKNEKLNNQDTGGVIEINLARIAAMLWKKLWIIVLAGVLAGAAAFGYAKFMITPMYSSSITMYVNNSSIQDRNDYISASELAAAQSLVRTYLAILQSRDSLEPVLEEAGSNYSWRQLMGMIRAESVDGTELFKITVTTTDPYEAQRLANAISVVLPERVVSIIDGSSVQLVSRAELELNKISPNVSKYTATGLFAGIFLACAILVVLDLINDVIRDEKYIVQTFDLPVLAKVPDMLDEHANRYGYYKKYGKYGHNPYESEADS